MLPEPTPAPFRCDHSLRAASAALFRAASSSSSFRFAAISSSISSSLYPLVSYSSLISTSFTSISRRRLWSTISSLGARAMARSTFESLLIWCDSWRRRRLNLFVCT